MISACATGLLLSGKWCRCRCRSTGTTVAVEATVSRMAGLPSTAAPSLLTPRRGAAHSRAAPARWLAHRAARRCRACLPERCWCCRTSAAQWFRRRRLPGFEHGVLVAEDEAHMTGQDVDAVVAVVAVVAPPWPSWLRRALAGRDGPSRPAYRRVVGSAGLTVRPFTRPGLSRSRWSTSSCAATRSSRATW